jgi:hypothetical protein
MKTIMRGTALVLSLAAAGCGGKGESPAAHSPEKARAAAEAPKPAEGATGPYITAFRIGHGLAPNGAVVGEGSVFAPGETIYVSFDVPNAPPDGKVLLRWQSAGDNKTVHETEVALAAQSPNVSSKTETTGWPPGDYILYKYLSAPSAGFENLKLGTATAKIVRERPK